MSLLYNNAVKQTQSLRKDLGIFEKDIVNTPLSTIGQITTTLTQLGRTLHEYEDLISKETMSVNEEKKAKNETRLLRLRTELSEYKMKFQGLKKNREEQLAEISKTQLFNGMTSTGSDNPYNQDNTIVNRHGASSSMDNNRAPQYSGMSMEDGLYKEKSILQKSNQQLDDIIEMGRLTFNDIVEQNEMIARAQRKIVGSLETLGVSRATIRQIEKKAFEDKWIFYIGAAFTLYCFYLILKYLR